MMKTIQVTIDEPLLDRLDFALARSGGEPRSAFIRRAVEEALFEAEEAEREKKHRDGYTARPLSPDESTWPTDEDAWESL